MSDSITFLGTSDGLPSPDRHHASLLLRLAGQTTLLDCGEPCSYTLKRMGFDFNSLDTIIVTHSHSDHIGGLPMLLQSLWLEQRTRPLTISLPPGIIQPLRDWLHACYLFEEQFGFEIQWQPLGHGALPTTHLNSTRTEFAAKYPGVKFEAFSVRFGNRLGYSGDIGDPTDLAPLFPLDLLVCELAHFHPQKLADFLNDKPIKQLALTHLSRQARERLPEVQKIFSGLPAHFVQDGETIPL